MEKLTKIQAELKAPKNQYNSFGKYKYRSCEDILEAVKPLLEKYNCSLTLSDEVKEVGGLIFIESVVSLSDNDKEDYIEEVKAQAGINPNRKGMDVAQSFGSSSSYARKYALNGLFLIDDTKDADTQDNSKVSKNKLTVQQFEKTKIASKTQIQKVLNGFDMTEEQRKELLNLIK